jgi:hypothetical protein
MLAADQSAPEPPAALRRPNLQVLTKVPESQRFLMMNAISDSLGVRCDYCHVRESDVHEHSPRCRCRRCDIRTARRPGAEGATAAGH